jgi:UDP-N-acetylglucosamine 2-epimerase
VPSDREANTLVTFHGAENVDNAERLEELLRGLALVADTYREPMVVSLHPRTADKLAHFGLDPNRSVCGCLGRSACLIL